MCFFGGELGGSCSCYPQKKAPNMAMEHPPFEDVFPIENDDVPMSC